MPIRKFFAKRITTSPIPPDPEPSNEAIGGWGQVYNSGIGVTGGSGGTVRYFDNIITLLDAMIASGNGSFWDTPEIYVYTGVTNANLVDGGINRQYIIDDVANKTLLCNNGQTLINGEIRFLQSENIIVRNIKREYYYTHGDYLIPKDEAANRDGFTFNECIGVWVDHIHINGRNQYGGVTLGNEYFDGGIDINESNYITISNSFFDGADRAILLGYGDTQIDNRGLLNVTIRNSKFTNIRQRAPRARFGKIHLLNNLFEWSPVWGTSGLNRPSTVRFVQTGNESQIYGQNNWFDNGQNLSTDPDTGSPKLSGLLLEGSYVGSFSSSAITSLRSGNVVWRPNTTTFYTYAIPLQTPTQAKEYVNIWAGAKFHLKEPIV